MAVRLPRGVYPESCEILRCAQNDTRRRARNDNFLRHCEERSDEAISIEGRRWLSCGDCHASLAMTVRKVFDTLRMSSDITTKGYNGSPFGKSYNPYPP